MRMTVPAHDYIEFKDEDKIRRACESQCIYILFSSSFSQRQGRGFLCRMMRIDVGSSE